MALNIPNTTDIGEAFSSGMKDTSSMLHNMMLNKYYGQLHPSGDVANALYVEQMRRLYGDTDPRYLKAKEAHELGLVARQSLINNRDVNTQLGPYRVTSPLGREINEGRGKGALDIVKIPGQTNNRVSSVTGQQGYDQNGNPVYPENSGIDEEKSEAYERSIAKKTSDAAVRNKIPSAENIEKTLGTIKLEDLTRYSGLRGTWDRVKDEMKAAATGKTPDSLIKHNEAVESASFLADQIRQFYGDSIQPVAMQRLRELTNPAVWHKNPDIAAAQFNQLTKILGMETDTLKKAGKSPVHLTNKIGFQNGKFVESKQKAPVKNVNAELKDNEQNDANDIDYATAMSEQLIDTFPEATPEKIIDTAQKRGVSVNDVVKFLLDKKMKMSGGQ